MSDHETIRRYAEQHDLCPCPEDLVIHCGFEVYEAVKFAANVLAIKQKFGLPIEFECDHASTIACLAALQARLQEGRS